MEIPSTHQSNRKMRLKRRIILGCLIVAAAGATIYQFSSAPNPAEPSFPISPSPENTSGTSTGAVTPVINSSTVSSPVTLPPQHPLSSKFGISFGYTLTALSDDELNKRFSDLASLGVGWVRFDLSWNNIQPNSPNQFIWTNVDRVVAAANAHGLILLMNIAYTPPWARKAVCSTSDKCAPSDPGLFATFVKQAVRRYGPQGVSSWEIWNEPNLTGFWQPQPNAKDYTALLQAAYGTIKSEQPSSTVVSGGLAPVQTKDGNIAPLVFLAQLYQQGAQPYFDALGFHPYSFPAPPSDALSKNAWWQMASTTPSLRSIMTANGDANKKIWLTEYGAPTGGPGILATENNYQSTQNADHVTETLQAVILSDSVHSVLALPWAGPLFWYSYEDIGTSTNTNENFFGLIRNDGSVKPAYNTLKTLLTASN